MQSSERITELHDYIVDSGDCRRYFQDFITAYILKFSLSIECESLRYFHIEKNKCSDWGYFTFLPFSGRRRSQMGGSSIPQQNFQYTRNTRKRSLTLVNNHKIKPLQSLLQSHYKASYNTTITLNKPLICSLFKFIYTILYYLIPSHTISHPIILP